MRCCAVPPKAMPIRGWCCDPCRSRRRDCRRAALAWHALPRSGHPAQCRLRLPWPRAWGLARGGGRRAASHPTLAFWDSVRMLVADETPTRRWACNPCCGVGRVCRPTLKLNSCPGGSRQRLIPQIKDRLSGPCHKTSSASISPRAGSTPSRCRPGSTRGLPPRTRRLRSLPAPRRTRWWFAKPRADPSAR